LSTRCVWKLFILLWCQRTNLECHKTVVEKYSIPSLYVMHQIDTQTYGCISWIRNINRSKAILRNFKTSTIRNVIFRIAEKQKVKWMEHILRGPPVLLWLIRCQTLRTSFWKMNHFYNLSIFFLLIKSFIPVFL